MRRHYILKYNVDVPWSKDRTMLIKTYRWWMFGEWDGMTGDGAKLALLGFNGGDDNVDIFLYACFSSFAERICFFQRRIVEFNRTIWGNVKLLCVFIVNDHGFFARLIFWSCCDEGRGDNIINILRL